MPRWAVLACALLAPVVAVAQPIEGLYIGGAAGGNAAGSLQSSQDNTKIYVNPGPIGLIALGWGFGNGVRGEIEGSYRSIGIDSIYTHRVSGVFEPLANPGGTAQTYAIMANVAYDIPLGQFRFPLQPYVGAGAGYGWLDLNGGGGQGFASFPLPDNNRFGPTPDTVSFGTAGAFAYQAMIGASVPIDVVPGLEATLEYRFFGMARADVPVTRVALTTERVNGAIPGSETRNGFTLQDSALLLGLRYRFGAP